MKLFKKEPQKRSELQEALDVARIERSNEISCKVLAVLPLAHQDIKDKLGLDFHYANRTLGLNDNIDSLWFKRDDISIWWSPATRTLYYGSDEINSMKDLAKAIDRQAYYSNVYGEY
jgi:hypothetical protein